MRQSKQSKFSITKGPSNLTSARQTGTSFTKTTEELKKEYRDKEINQINDKLQTYLSLKLNNNDIPEESTLEEQTIEEDEIFQNKSAVLDLKSPIPSKKKAPANIAHDILSKE